MPRLRPDRKKRFKAALALSGMKMQDWAGQAEVTPQHLNATLNEQRESNRLIEKVDAFIADVEAKVMAA